MPSGGRLARDPVLSLTHGRVVTRARRRLLSVPESSFWLPTGSTTAIRAAAGGAAADGAQVARPFAEYGLTDEPRPGRPQTITDERWTRRSSRGSRRRRRSGALATRSMARDVGSHRPRSHRTWRALGCNPAADMEAVQGPGVRRNVREVVRLYLNPPERALVAVRK